ncbi:MULTISPECIES: VC2046/SO_2500 family protein [Vibrio]|uniref:VC2046/SO_2500 family protein n=1 Tax=Vibrio TaxID=662 RepID=UPI000C171648|nr:MULTISPECIES: VC2046/SO_2500 family protein [Vibrio]NNN43326.1 hypothetical protein [Vibrio sp. 1-1(7)]NNN71150.1 hypothetical protein [Vibrio sp. 12-2(3-a)]
MQVHTLDKAGIINELHIGSNINQAIQHGRHADFALFMALFSNDVRDACPVEPIEEKITTEQLLRKQFSLPELQPLRNDHSSYQISAQQAHCFHSGGLASAKLSHYLKPEALTYLPEATQGFPEEVYLNLSGHDRRHLATTSANRLLTTDLYPQLNTAWRQDQLRAQA